MVMTSPFRPPPLNGLVFEPSIERMLLKSLVEKFPPTNVALPEVASVFTVDEVPKLSPALSKVELVKLVGSITDWLGSYSKRLLRPPLEETRIKPTRWATTVWYILAWGRCECY
jgi:hypothetical protein